jgi:hypothetical protein
MDDKNRKDVAVPLAEVPMIEPDSVLQARGYDVGLRAIQKPTRNLRRKRLVSARATVRRETAPGAQSRSKLGVLRRQCRSKANETPRPVLRP